VADVIKVIVTYQHTDEVIQERNRLNVPFVANDLHRLETLLDTTESTVDHSHESPHRRQTVLVFTV